MSRDFLRLISPGWDGDDAWCNRSGKNPEVRYLRKENGKCMDMEKEKIPENDQEQ